MEYFMCQRGEESRTEVYWSDVHWNMQSNIPIITLLLRLQSDSQSEHGESFAKVRRKWEWHTSWEETPVEVSISRLHEQLVNQKGIGITSAETEKNTRRGKRNIKLTEY